MFTVAFGHSAGSKLVEVGTRVGEEEGGRERERVCNWKNKAERERKAKAKSKGSLERGMGRMRHATPPIPCIQRLGFFHLCLSGPLGCHARQTQPACRSEAIEGYLLVRQKREQQLRCGRSVSVPDENSHAICGQLPCVWSWC